MATGQSRNGDAVISSEAALAGILALLATERDDRLGETPTDKQRRTELVLADAGLTATEIGIVLNKKPGTVAKAVSRARAKGSEG